MRNSFTATVLALAFTVTPALVGCNRTVSKDETTKTNPDTGKTSHDEKKVEKTPDGGTKTTEEHKTSNP